MCTWKIIDMCGGEWGKEVSEKRIRENENVTEMETQAELVFPPAATMDEEMLVDGYWGVGHLDAIQRQWAQ